MAKALLKSKLSMSRLDVHLSERMKATALALAADQGCTSVSEYVRMLIRADAKCRGIELPEEYPMKEVKR